VAALDHSRQYRLRGVDHAHEIDVHHPLEQRRIGTAERRGFRRARIGNEDVDRLPRGGFGNGRFDRRLIGDVGTAANCAAPDATASSSVARLRPSTVTVAPAFDSAADIASPMPRPPPVTSAWEERDNGDIGQASRMRVQHIF
jgi:hypothetical protein